MPYSDVPQRLIDGEGVPRSEIIGYAEPYSITQVTFFLACCVFCTLMTVDYDEGSAIYTLTPFALMLREDFIVRLEGECPECP